MPEGMSWVSPGFSSRGASMQARRSTPAEPSVAYCGNGKSRPMRGSRMRTSSRCRAPAACAPSAGMGRTRRLHSDRALLLGGAVAFGDHFHELPRQRELAGERQLALAAVCPIHRQRILVLVEGKPAADFVGRDHVEILAGE